MSAELRKLPTKDLGNKGCVDLLREWLAKAESGELIALELIGEERSSYITARSNMSFEKAMGLHVRSIYWLNMDWDNEKKT